MDEQSVSTSAGETTGVPKTHMKNSTKILVGLGIVLVLCAASLVIGMTITADPANADQPKEYPAQAIELGKWIDVGSEKYRAAKAEKEEYEAKAKEANERMAKAALSNSGLRMTLCNEFRVLRQSGSFLPISDDVQCGTVVTFQ